MKSKILNYNIILESESDGGFTVVVPKLPGCVTCGKNLQEAKKMAEDAIKCYIKSLVKHKEPVPTDEKSFVSHINFELPKLNQQIQYVSVANFKTKRISKKVRKAWF